MPVCSLPERVGKPAAKTGHATQAAAGDEQEGHVVQAILDKCEEPLIGSILCRLYVEPRQQYLVQPTNILQKKKKNKTEVGLATILN